MSSTSPATTTALFDLLPAYFNKEKDDILTFLTQPGMGVSSAVAKMVAQALSQADGVIHLRPTRPWTSARSSTSSPV